MAQQTIRNKRKQGPIGNLKLLPGELGIAGDKIYFGPKNSDTDSVEITPERILDEKDFKALLEVANGRKTAYAVDTVDEATNLMLTLKEEGTISVGDVFYVRANNIPDLWYDGTELLPLEANTDLSAYATTEAMVSSLANKVNKGDVVDHLESIETIKPLSANQGRSLKALIDELNRRTEMALTAESVVNNLVTADVTKPLSAAQGKVLREDIDSFKSHVSDYLAGLDAGLWE